MMRKPFWPGLMLVLGCLLLLFIISTSHGGLVTATPVQATPTNVNVPASTRGLGLPAIRPSILAPASVRFTISDVQAYLQTHPFPGGHPVPGATASVVTIQFMTSEQASALMHGAQTGLPATASVCYVKLHGPFTQEGSPVPPGGQLPTVDYGVEIFDAQTGNLLMWWTPSA